MKITTLIENHESQDNKQLCAEHGLSMLLELDGLRLLFDTGQSGAFLSNIPYLIKEPKAVDAIILSHGHYDHTSGVIPYLRTYQGHPKIYVGNGFFSQKYKLLEDGSYHYNGIPFTKDELLSYQVSLHTVNHSVTQISNHAYLFRGFPMKTTYELRNPKFYRLEKNDFIPDDFCDEIVLGVRTKKGLVIVAGCSHPGIINILTSIQEHMKLPIYAVFGGTHLVEANEERMKETVRALRKIAPHIIAVSHCTGEEGERYLSNEIPELYLANHTGRIIEL